MMENYSLVGNSIIDLYDVSCAFPPFFLIPVATLGLGWVFKIWLWGTTPTSKTKSIVILGRKASGKTTLWNRLKGYNFNANYAVTTLEEVEQFKIKRDDKEIIIQATKDIGGGDNWVHEYEELIKEKTFILFLVDATDNSSDARKGIRGRVRKLQHIINDNRLDKVGFRIYITHSDEYMSKNPKKSKADIVEEIMKWLDLESVRGNKKVKYEYVAVNLSCDKDIDIIKKEIIDRVYE